MISFAITVCDELIELHNLVNLLLTYIDLESDEIVIQCDSKKTNNLVINYLKNLEKICNVSYFEFDNDFAKLKNSLNSKCTKPYIFQLDADELPDIFLLTNLKNILIDNPDIELFSIPRENYVSGITEKHLNEWKWNIDQIGRVNFPDYQGRLYKNHPNIKWTRKVHEYITGARNRANLPPDKRFSLLHNKHINKQEKSFNYYSELWDTI